MAYCAASPGLLLHMSGITRRLLPILLNVIQRSCMFTSQLGLDLSQTLILSLRFLEHLFELGLIMISCSLKS